jgi:transcription initiation factor TFIIIB Brf1 subunit/transcription initiation factor TFIIB
MSLDKYLDMSDEQIDNLLMGLSLNAAKTDGKKKNQVCANCKSPNLILDVSNFVCTDCGMISVEYLNENPDIPNGENEASASSRYGSQTSFFFPKASMGTKIATKGFNRLSLIQRQGQMPYKEKNLMEILDIIQSKCKKYNISYSASRMICLKFDERGKSSFIQKRDKNNHFCFAKI